MASHSLKEGGLGGLLGYRLAQARVSTNAVFDQHAGAPLGLKPVEFSMLALLCANPGVAPAKLARALAISRPQATQCLDRLEAKGLAQRQPSSTDGRGFEVSATAEGERSAKLAIEALQAAERAQLASLSAAEHGMLLELLGKLARVPRAAG